MQWLWKMTFYTRLRLCRTYFPSQAHYSLPSELWRLYKGQTKAGQKSAAGWAKLAVLVSCWKLKGHQVGPNLEAFCCSVPGNIFSVSFPWKIWDHVNNALKMHNITKCIQIIVISLEQQQCLEKVTNSWPLASKLHNLFSKHTPCKSFKIWTEQYTMEPAKMFRRKLFRFGGVGVFRKNSRLSHEKMDLSNSCSTNLALC